MTEAAPAARVEIGARSCDWVAVRTSAGGADVLSELGARLRVDRNARSHDVWPLRSDEVEGEHSLERDIGTRLQGTNRPGRQGRSSSRARRSSRARPTSAA